MNRILNPATTLQPKVTIPQSLMPGSRIASPLTAPGKTELRWLMAGERFESFDSVACISEHTTDSVSRHSSLTIIGRNVDVAIALRHQKVTVGTEPMQSAESRARVRTRVLACACGMRRCACVHVPVESI